MIVGIDEVGRGCLAGPLCVGVVALDDTIEGLADSKTLTAQKRRKLAYEVKKRAKLVNIGWASHAIIDKHGISTALKIATLRALAPFDARITKILLDGNYNYIKDERVVTIIKGDATEPIISAASIVAKVSRDAYMASMARCYPEFGFESHVGYATTAHRKAIAECGPSPIHRLSFAPLAEKVVKADTTTALGRRAEDVAADFLRLHGYEIIAQNWRTKWCEIDIVATNGNRVSFVEVKYRRTRSWGTGIEYITPQKQQQMEFAAAFWVGKHEWQGDYSVAAIEVSGAQFRVTDWIEDVTK